LDTMWTTIATFKENLSQIASDVQDTADELEIGRGSERRPLEGPAERKPLLGNGIDPNVKAELEWYKGEIQRLQNSEAEIQAMSINYASLLKEREEELSRLHDENGKLKKTMAGATAGYMLANGGDRKSMEVSDTSKVGDSSLNGLEVLQICMRSIHCRDIWMCLLPDNKGIQMLLVPKTAKVINVFMASIQILVQL